MIVLEEKLWDNLDMYPQGDAYVIKPAINSVETYYAIDFGYEEGTDEFNDLPDNFRFRLKDPIFNYNYEAIKRNNQWDFTYGNLHCKCSGKAFAAFNYLDDTGGKAAGPSIIMNDSNKIALQYMMKCIGKPTTDSWEVMYKNLWDACTITIDNNEIGEAAFKLDSVKTTKKEEGHNQYCYMGIDYEIYSTNYILNKEYSIRMQRDNLIDITWKWSCSSLFDSGAEPGTSTTAFHTITDCFELFPFEFHSTLLFNQQTRANRLRFYATPDFLVWDVNVSYNKGTNIWRFLYDKDYVIIEHRPESCSALMTNKNLITDGIVVAQNLETHLHSLNQVANAGEELATHVAYTDNVLADIIQNLASINEFIRLTMITDFVCLGIEGVAAITKFGPKFARGFQESAFSFSERPILREITETDRVWNRIGSEVSDLSLEGRSAMIEAEELSEIGRSCSREASESISDSCSVYSANARELYEIEAPLLNIEANSVNIRSGSLNILGDGSHMAEIGITRTFEEAMEETLRLDRTYTHAGSNLLSRFGIVLDGRHLELLKDYLGAAFVAFQFAERGIRWGIQLGTKIKYGMEFKLLEDDKLEAYFTPDRFIWSVVDANQIYTPHTLVGIAKYDEMNGWDDSKIVTAQALLHNYYSKEEIDAKLANNDSASNSNGSSNSITDFTTSQNINFTSTSNIIQTTIASTFNNTVSNNNISFRIEEIDASVGHWISMSGNYSTLYTSKNKQNGTNNFNISNVLGTLSLSCVMGDISISGQNGIKLENDTSITGHITV
ncbi:MAG: hypothetical protein J6R47_03170, partial [Acholeplasmatales bacterium]|nr:hypothetical protein [Acholeplasmatales bacterium]